MAERWVRLVSIPGGGGAGVGYWETMWAAEKLDVPDALSKVLARRVEGRTTVLEAGCGQGAVMQFLRRPDRWVAGIDLADRSLADAKRADPTLPFAAADVERLPFSDASFDAVLSLGVVEHLPHGPVGALGEHRRVLAPGGVLIITVPARSWLRAVSDRWHFDVRRQHTYKQGGRIVTRRRGVHGDLPADFHQYELSRRQLVTAVEAAGLRVLHWEALDVGTGLRDLRPGGSPVARVELAASPAPAPPRRWRRTIRHLTTSTEPAGRVAATCRKLTLRMLGHMQLVVASDAAAPPIDVSG